MFGLFQREHVMESVYGAKILVCLKDVAYYMLCFEVEQFSEVPNVPVIFSATDRNTTPSRQGQVFMSANHFECSSAYTTQYIDIFARMKKSIIIPFHRFFSSLATLIRADEAPLFIGYLALEGTGDDGCLNRAACKTPATAKEYLRAARAIVKGAEMLDARFNATHNYSYTMNQLEMAIRKGFEGVSCDTIYNCNI